MELQSKALYQNSTVAKQIKFWGETDPDTPAFIFWGSAGRYVLSRGQVFNLSCRFASRLAKRGVISGDLVCIALPDSPERLVVEFGVHLAGAVSMNGVALQSDGMDLIESINRAQCTIIVTDLRVWKVCEPYIETSRRKENYISVESTQIPSLKVMEICSTDKNKKSFLRSLESEETFFNNQAKPSDVAVVWTTSGSTGYTKLVTHTHEDVLRIGYCMASIYQLAPNEAQFSIVPLGIIGGFPSHFLYTGCPRVLLDESVPITDRTAMTWEAICKENALGACLIPLMYMPMYERPHLWQNTDRMLKCILSGAQPINKGSMEIIGKFTHSICNLYGSTEVGFTHRLMVDINNVNTFQDYNVGYPWDGVETKIVDEHLQPVPTGTRGEILVRSPTLTKGYIGDSGPTRGFLADGWFRMDDTGFITEDGCLIVEGRCSDVINLGPFLLYPSWLEQQMVNCPGVKQVFIVPVPDELQHHQICACIQTVDGAEVTVEHVLNYSKTEIARDPAQHMNIVPKYVLFFDDFPTKGPGKLDRKTLALIAQSKLYL